MLDGGGRAMYKGAAGNAKIIVTWAWFPSNVVVLRELLPRLVNRANRFKIAFHSAQLVCLKILSSVTADSFLSRKETNLPCTS